MGLVNQILQFLLVIVAQTQSLGEDLDSESTTVHLGVHVFYDRQVYKNIRDPYGHEYPAKPGTPNGYFASFLAAVQLTFRDMKNLNLNISLVNSTLLNDNRVPVVAVSASGYADTIKGKETISMLHQELKMYHPQVLQEADVVFYITSKYIMTEFVGDGIDRMLLHFGVPKTGGVCKNDSSNIGVVTDDGKTFDGVRDMAQQLAVLLGTSLDSKCRKKEKYMPPTVFAEGRSTLSNCSKKEIYDFLSSKKSSEECWMTPPEKVAESNNVLPAVFNKITGYDVCTAGTTPYKREVRECEERDKRRDFNRLCQVQCCEYNSRFARNGLSLFLRGQIVADGSPCRNNQTCIHGKCEDWNPQPE